MIKNYSRTILSAFELIVYLLCILFFSTGRADGLLTKMFTGAEETMPYIIFINIFLALLFVVFIGLSRINSAVLTGSRSVFLLSFIIIAAIHISVNNTIPYSYPSSPLYHFYYALIIVYGALGNGTLLLTVFSFFLVSELFRLIPFPVINMQEQLSYSEIINQIFPVIPHIGYVAAVGGLSYFVSTIRIKDRELKMSKKSTAALSSAYPNPEQTKALLMPPKTRIYSIDTVKQSNSEYSSEAEDLSSVVFFMSRNFNAYSALAFTYDNQKKVFILNSFYSKSGSIIRNAQIPAGVGIVGNLALEKVSFLSGNLTNYERGLNYYSTDEIIYSILAVPILSFKNELLGALVIDNQDKLAFRDHHKEILKRFSNLAAALITNMRMRLYQEHAAKQFQIFYEASQQFTTVQYSDQVLDILFKMIDSVTTYTRVMAVDFQADSNNCVLKKIVSTTNEIKEGVSFTLNDGLYSTAVKKRQIINIDNYEKYSKNYYLFVPDEWVNPNIRSIIIIPIVTAESLCLGVISIESNIPGQFTGELGRILTTLVGNASVAYQKAFLYQKMELLATTDGLTQINNHRTFQKCLHDEIVRSHRYKHSLSLLIMDIDHFKNFNDTYGHQVGDIVLKEIASCIRQTIRNNDIPARYGGEEFAVILPETSSDQAGIIGERIRRNIESHTVSFGNKDLHITVSIGCASLPQQATTQQQIISYADKAMYYSKEHGRNRFTLYQKNM